MSPACASVRGSQRLQDTAFVHSIDAPSLALIVPLLLLGLEDRSAVLKVCAAWRFLHNFHPHPNLLAGL